MSVAGIQRDQPSAVLCVFVLPQQLMKMKMMMMTLASLAADDHTLIHNIIQFA